MQTKNNMVYSAREKTRWIDNVNSARKAALKLNLSNNTFSKALEAGDIIPQAVIEGDMRNSYGFEDAYLEEIDSALPKKRTNNQRIFTPEVKLKLRKINNNWQK